MLNLISYQGSYHMKDEMNSKQQKYYDDLCIIARSKGGRIVSQVYINSYS
jgi:hypothetical protein